MTGLGYFTSRYLPLRDESIFPHKHMCINVHKFFCSSSKLKMTQKSINK